MSKRIDGGQDEGSNERYDGSLPRSITRLNPRTKMIIDWAAMAIDVPENRLVSDFTALNLEETNPIWDSESSLPLSQQASSLES